MRILVAYASADGSTEEVAERIADQLCRLGADAVARPVPSIDGLDGFDAVFLGSAVHGRHWLDPAIEFVNTHHQALARLPLYTFSVGMPDSWPRFFRWLVRTEEEAILDQLGGLRPREHCLFSGVVSPTQFPLTTRIFLRLMGARYGDFRDWAAIDAFAGEISGNLEPPR